MIGVWRRAVRAPPEELGEEVNGSEEIGDESVDSLGMWEAMSPVATGSGAYDHGEIALSAGEAATLPARGCRGAASVWFSGSGAFLRQHSAVLLSYQVDHRLSAEPPEISCGTTPIAVVLRKD